MLSGRSIIIPLLFLANELHEAESARQYGGHASLSGAIGGIALLLLAAGLFGTGSVHAPSLLFLWVEMEGVDQAPKN